MTQISESLRRLFDAVPEAVAVTRLHDGVCLDVNAKLIAFTGYSRSAFIGRSSLALGMWANTEARARFVAALRAHGKVERLPCTLRLQDGSTRDGSLSARVTEIEGQTCVVSVLRDISDRIRNERALRRSKERLRELIDLAVDGIILWDEHGCIIDINERACNLIGEPRDRLLGRHASEFVAPESLAATPLAYDPDGTRGKIVNERQFLGKDGTRTTVEVLTKRMPDGTYHSFVRDLSERRRAEQERAELENRLRDAQRNEALGRIAAGIAHDFNNLLTPIMGAAALVLRDPRLPPEARSELETIREAGERAARFIKQIQSYSHCPMPDLRPLDLNAEIGQAARVLPRLIGDSIAFETRLDAALPLVLADSSQVQQILLNLLVNARDAMPAGGRIEVATSLLEQGERAGPSGAELQPGHYVRLDVTDTGTGMEEDTIRHAFDPLFTTKAEGRGTGLGLAIVSGIVQQHGGAVWAESELGTGTRFTVCLPVAGTPPK